MWRYAFASAIGTSHTQGATPCQDSAVCEVIVTPLQEEVLVAIASDGAGSAAKSDVGSAAACATVLEAVRQYLCSGQPVAAITETDARTFVAQAVDRLRTLAMAENATLRDFACTLLVAIIGSDAAVYFQVGDGAIIILPPDSQLFSCVFWPERGEYANTTVFITDERVNERIVFDTGVSISEVAVLTDGIQGMVLDYKTETAHDPFFQRMLSPLRGRKETGPLPDLSEALRQYLQSPKVNERTDDDKTLILASRR